jgi:hypothetical protein
MHPGPVQAQAVVGAHESRSMSTRSTIAVHLIHGRPHAHCLFPFRNRGSRPARNFLTSMRPEIGSASGGATTGSMGRIVCRDEAREEVAAASVPRDGCTLWARPRRTWIRRREVCPGGTQESARHWRSLAEQGGCGILHFASARSRRADWPQKSSRRPGGPRAPGRPRNSSRRPTRPRAAAGRRNLLASRRRLEQRLGAEIFSPSGETSSSRQAAEFFSPPGETSSSGLATEFFSPLGETSTSGLAAEFFTPPDATLSSGWPQKSSRSRWCTTCSSSASSPGSRWGR